MRILEFIQKLKEKRKADELIAWVNPNDGADMHMALQQRILFHVCYTHYGLNNPNTRLFILDDDDLLYLENKYKPLLEVERQEEINEINKKYENNKS